MAGYREFQTGEVLSAANVNNFLMEQATMTFADAAARDAALAEVLRAGLNVYLQDTDRLQYYDGTDWQNVPNESDVDAAGGLVAVKHAIRTSIFTASIAGGASAVVTGLEISHAAADEDNIIYLFGLLNGSHNDANVVAGSIAADGTLLDVGDAAGTRQRINASNTGSGNDKPSSVMLFAKHAPNSTTSVDYDVRVQPLRGAGPTQVRVNYAQTDTDGTFVGRAVSALLLLEVKV